MTFKNYILFFIFLTCFKSYSQVINKLDKAKSDSIETLIADLIKYQEVAGMAISITQNDQIVYLNTYGLKNINNTLDPINKNSIFHFASISKTFVSSAILKLYSDKKLKLSDPISKYINNSTISDSLFNKITIQHLLNHTSGIAGIEDHHWTEPKFDKEALKNYVLSRQIKLLSEPGVKFNYSDIGYELLGYVIEKTSGMSFEQYIKINFLVPLQMKETTFLKGELREKQYACPHVYDYDSCKVKVSTIYPYNREHAPSSTLQSTVLDFCNFAIFHLNKGTFKNKEILKKDVYSILWDTAATAHWSEVYKYYGAGWFIGNLDGQKIIHHSGNDHGFRANFILLPDQNISITIASNYYQTRVLDLGQQIAAVFTQKNYTPESLSDNLNEFEGKYCSDSSCVEIVLQPNHRLSLIRQTEIDCLVSAPYKGIFTGKYMEGNSVKPYYSPSNIWLQKSITPQGEKQYEVKIKKEKFKKINF